jgi:CelD/BcsL family acetyltransferase involved in cellulose biosynthesis
MQVRQRETAPESHRAHGQDAPTHQRHGALGTGSRAHDPTPHRTSGDELITSAPLFPPDWPLNPTLAERARESICFSKPWLDLIKRVYGYQIFYLTTTGTDGRLAGALPVCCVRSPLGRKHLVALPFSDLCPLLTTDAVSASSLIEQAICLAHQQGARYLELRAGADAILAAHQDLTAHDLYLRYWLPLAGDVAALWRGLSPSVRTKVNKAQRLGVRVRMASSREDMLHFYRLHLQTRSRKHGMPAQPKSFFLGLWDAFAAEGGVAGGGIEVFLAEYEGLVVAADIVLTAGATAKWMYAASDERYLHLAPNHLLMWSVIEYACLQGHRALDLGRTAQDNPGLMEFKRRLGAVEEPLTYYYYPRPAGLAATSESSRKYKILTASWKHLPLPIAASLGGHLYKYLG